MEDMDAGLKALQNVIRDKEVRSIAIPPLGSGLGGLNWNEVRPRIEEAPRGFNRSACRALRAEWRPGARSGGEATISAENDPRPLRVAAAGAVAN